MRETEFRGRDKLYDGTYGPWFYGWYTDYGIFHEIHDKHGVEHSVEPETVGQYTGLKDKHGVKIYEGDMVSCNTFRGVVKYNSYTASFQAVSAGWWPISLEYDKHDPFEVIGNIFDNPELDKQFGEVYRKEQ